LTAARAQVGYTFIMNTDIFTLSTTWDGTTAKLFGLGKVIATSDQPITDPDAFFAKWALTGMAYKSVILSIDAVPTVRQLPNSVLRYDFTWGDLRLSVTLREAAVLYVGVPFDVATFRNDIEYLHPSDTAETALTNLAINIEGTLLNVRI